MNAKRFKDVIERKGFFRSYLFISLFIYLLLFRSYLEEVVGSLDKLRQHSHGSRSF